MCNSKTEDWHHVIMCGSLDASFHRAASWGKLMELMEWWHLPQVLCNMIEKGINYYTDHPHKNTIDSKNNKPHKPFAVTLTTSRNLLQQAFRIQSYIGRENSLKCRVSRYWLTCVRYNEVHSNIQGKSKDRSTKFIGGLWKHLKCVSQFWNNIYHQENE
jgi:hypothetical protein